MSKRNSRFDVTFRKRVGDGDRYGYVIFSVWAENGEDAVKLALQELVDGSAWLLDGLRQT